MQKLLQECGADEFIKDTQRLSWMLSTKNVIVQIFLKTVEVSNLDHLPANPPFFLVVLSVRFQRANILLTLFKQPSKLQHFCT